MGEQRFVTSIVDITSAGSTGPERVQNAFMNLDLQFLLGLFVGVDREGLKNRIGRKNDVVGLP